MLKLALRQKCHKYIRYKIRIAKAIFAIWNLTKAKHPKTHIIYSYIAEIIFCGVAFAFIMCGAVLQTDLMSAF